MSSEKFRSLHIRVWLSILFASVLVAVIAGCGGGGGSSLPALPPFVPGSVSDSEREAAFSDIETFFHGVHGQPNAAAQVVARMKTLPQFVYAEIGSSGDAIGWFKDGQMYAVFTSDVLPHGLGPAIQSGAKRTAQSRDLPAGQAAYLIDAFEPARSDAGATITPELVAKGYSVIQLQGLVNDYKAISNASLLLVHAHGVLSTDKFRVPRFWYATSEAPTVQKNNNDYAAYWAAGTIATGSADEIQADGTSKPVRRYCISNQFLKDAGITFTRNAFWMSQSCSSYNPIMVQTALNFTGVSVYAGWTLPEVTDESTPTTLFVFDRLLGLNGVAPIDPDNPPPMDFSTLDDKLRTTDRPGQSLNYGTSNGEEGASYFEITSGRGSNLPTIIPSVASANIDPSTGDLEVDGHFGNPQGSVALDGNLLDIQSWSETKIKVSRPSATSGTLVVRSIGDSSSQGYLLSNPFQYTGLAVQINAPNTELDKSQTETLTVVATSGAIPQGVSYKWTVTGLGTVNGGSTATTTSPSVTYHAPAQDSSEVVTVRIVASNNTVLAQAQIALTVGDTPRIQFTIAGTWTDGFTNTQLGDYAFTDGIGAKTTLNGTDYYFFEYDNYVDNQNNNSSGVTVTIGQPLGQAITANETFTLAPNGMLTGANQFKLLLSLDINHPNGTGEYNPQGTGTLTITSVGVLSNGKHVAHFTFTITSPQGGTISGSGVDTWP